jgi:hypothetical protein
VDLAIVNLEWMIHLARNGDGEPLAKWLRRDKPVEPVLRKFLADVIAGKIKLKRPTKRTYLWKVNRFQREQMVVTMVDYQMRQKGRLRDTTLRTGLTDDWCIYYDTTPIAVAAYLKYQKGRAVKRRIPARK